MGLAGDGPSARGFRGWPSTLRSQREVAIIAAGFLIALFLFWFIWGRLLPAPNGSVGHDFSGMLPGLMAGRFWFESNGPFSIPWFIPSFCGGVWLFPSAGSYYYSAPQLLAFLVSPLAAVQITFLLFAAIGFLGTYLLVRRCFFASVAVALTAAVIMMFNGFYAYRGLVGHLIFHSFMLLPVICYAALRTSSGGEARSSVGFRDVTLQLLVIAFVWTYIIQSGAAQLLPHFVLAIALVLLAHGLVFSASWRPWLVMAAGGGLGLLLSAAKLAAAFSLLSALPRSGYKLAGASDLLEASGLILRSLFFQAPADATSQLENVQWALERHAWEYGLSPVALVLLLIGGAMLLRAANKDAIDRFLRNRIKVLYLGAALAFAFLPIALNTYGEGWHAVIKSTPILRSMSNMPTWICSYIPVLVVLCGVVLNRLSVAIPKHRIGLAIGVMASVVLYNGFTDKEFYKTQDYYPEPIEAAYRQLEATGKITPVIGTGVYLQPGTGVVQMPINRNDTFVNGWSQLACYEPQFGYRLEWFPQRTLQPGPATDIREGRYNFKDPSCYVFPEANKCEPGDQFKVGDEARMQKLLNYKPYRFRFSQIQEIANLVSLVAWIVAGLMLVLSLLSWFRSRPAREALI